MTNHLRWNRGLTNDPSCSICGALCEDILQIKFCEIVLRQGKADLAAPWCSSGCGWFLTAGLRDWLRTNFDIKTKDMHKVF